MTYEPQLVASMGSCYTSSHSARLVDPSYFSIPNDLKFRGQRTLFKLWEKAFTPPGLCPPFERTLSVRWVIIETIVVIVPFFTLLLFNALVLLTPIFDPATCISATDDVVQISVIPVSSSATFLRWSQTAC
jgi:hypothetical protein